MTNFNFLKLRTDDLTKATMPVVPFAAWIHFDRAFNDLDEEVFSYLIKAGCTYILISGVGSDEIHETVDDVVISESTGLILTLAAEFGNSAAFEFLSVRCPSGNCTAHVIICMSETKEEEERILNIMHGLLSDERSGMHSGLR